MASRPPASTTGSRSPRRRGLLLVPEFPDDSFWSYRHVLRLIGRKAAFPPLGLLTFAGYLPEDWDVELLDLNVRRASRRELRRKMAEADAAFVTAMSIQKRSLVRLLEVASGLDTPFVLGGPFASSYRDRILEPTSPSDRVLHEGLDVIVWGEACGSMDELLAWLSSRPVHSPARPRLLIPRSVESRPGGSRRYLQDRSLFRPLDDTPLPRWDLIRTRDYHSLSLQTTAGCPFRCDFCDIIQFNGGFNRPKSPARVRLELRAILDTGFRGSVFSVDDNFIGSPNDISRVLDAMVEFQREHAYPFTFYTQASVNLGKPELRPLVRKMKQAGFDAVFLGVENPDPGALRRMNKKQNLKVDVADTIARLQRAGIEVYAGFIVGSDGDTPSTIDNIVEFVKRTRIVSAMAGLLTPIPHTPLYERLEAEGRLLESEFSGNNTDDDVQFVPNEMSVSELALQIRSLLERLFNRAEAYRRARDMLEAVRPHVFSHKRLEIRFLEAGLRSFWSQGVRRLDRGYFVLLWSGFLLDWRIRRAARTEIRRLRLLVRQAREGGAVRLEDRRAWLGDQLERAQDYRVRFRPELGLDQVREWTAALEDRLARGALRAEDLARISREAIRNLKVERRLHRFPGVSLARAFEVAIKARHYEKVAEAVVGRRLRAG